MAFSVAAPWQAAILRQYEKNLSRYPVVRREVEAFLRDKGEDLALCLRYLYGHMAAQDVLSASPEVFAGYAEATLRAVRELEYLQSVPPEIFFPYVLYHRVNSECLDGSRGFLLRELLPHVKGKSMAQAALAVNYWCYAHATYTPADDRTLGPLAVLRRTLGRCGEESVLAVSALRSVGIPARQCYCPRWSHCDDNHAWVEVWIGGEWRYLGACEPEEALDRGWFTAAASRAMRVDTKCWADWDGDALYEEVNCTARYTGARVLTVQVRENGCPVAGARVRFQIVNYSELYTLWETATDEGGLARLETGAGDLFVCAQYGQRIALEKVDLRQQSILTLELKEALPAFLKADLTPPEERAETLPQEASTRHQELLRRCEAHLAARRGAFAGEEGYLRAAALNGAELRRFLDDDRYPQAQRLELLGTLREKDFADISCETLLDALDTAEDARGRWPAEIFRDYILAPRIADEMLRPERRKIRALFPGGFADPREILRWMRENLQILPDEGISNFYPSALGCLRCRQIPAFAFDPVFVALCRAFCFPARLEPHTGEAQWMDGQGVWRGIRGEESPVRLTLELPAGKKLHYSEHLSLGRWNGSDFVTLQYPGLTVESGCTFSLRPGLYRVTATTRQIDGTASVALWHLHLSADRTLRIAPPEDQTARRLKQIPLTLPEGPLTGLLREDSGRNALLIFADPGSEPTEHLLRELLDLAEDFRRDGCSILLLAKTAEALAHPTVRLVKDAIPQTELSCLWDGAALTALHRAMQVGDLRLPFVLCTDDRGRGVYADANYRIGMARTLLEIRRMLAE